MRKHLVAGFFSVFLLGMARANSDGVLHITLNAERGKTPVHFVVTDPQGRRVGQMTNGLPHFQEIPRAAYHLIAMGNEGGPGPLVEPEHAMADIIGFSSGTYLITVYAMSSSTFTLDVAPSANDGTNLPELVAQGALSAGTSIQYTAQLDPRPNTRPVFSKTITFDSLRQSLQAFRELGQIGKKEFVSRLDKLLAHGGIEAAKGKEKSAAALLEMFIRRLDKVSRKQTDEYDTDERPGTYERFVTAEALTLLKQDAGVLLSGLKKRD